MSKGEVQYFLMFFAGIAAFWLGGEAVSYIPAVTHNATLAGVIALATTLAIYGLVFAVLLLVTLGQQRSLKSILISTVLVLLLAVGSAQLLVTLGHGHIHNKLDVGFLTFASYIMYGAIYVLGNTLARRLSR
jgi:hypothetical protein